MSAHLKQVLGEIQQFNILWGNLTANPVLLKFERPTSQESIIIKIIKIQGQYSQSPVELVLESLFWSKGLKVKRFRVLKVLKVFRLRSRGLNVVKFYLMCFQKLLFSLSTPLSYQMVADPYFGVKTEDLSLHDSVWYGMAWLVWYGQYGMVWHG